MAPKSLLALSFTSRRNTSPGPPSPTFSDATNVSTMRFGAHRPSKIITRANLKSSVQAYEDVSRLGPHIIVCSGENSYSNSSVAILFVARLSSFLIHVEVIELRSSQCRRQQQHLQMLWSAVVGEQFS